MVTRGVCFYKSGRCPLILRWLTYAYQVLYPRFMFPSIEIYSEVRHIFKITCCLLPQRICYHRLSCVTSQFLEEKLQDLQTHRLGHLPA